MQPYEDVRRRMKTPPCFCLLELPVLVDRLDRPVELLAQRLGEELLNGDVELLGEDHSKTRVDVVLDVVSKILSRRNT